MTGNEFRASGRSGDYFRVRRTLEGKEPGTTVKEFVCECDTQTRLGLRRCGWCTWRSRTRHLRGEDGHLLYHGIIITRAGE